MIQPHHGIGPPHPAVRPSGPSVSGVFALLTAAIVSCSFTAGVAGQSRSESEVVYRLSFPTPQHRLVDVEVTFTALEATSLIVRMASASPGRYARHEFAKNIVELQAVDGSGTELTVSRSRAQVWQIDNHDGTVRLRYRLFGDRVDGTYLAVDSTHAHLNMPATLLWAEGLEDRPVRVVFDPPRDAGWRVATQLFPTAEPFVFTAPNLRYLLDSPTELSDFELRSFEVVESPSSSRVNRTKVRVAVHHDGSADAVDPYVAAIEAIVRETLTVFGELPTFDSDTYTFIVDYLPYANGDGMEHRNSSILTSGSRLDEPGQRTALLLTAAHEFFHVWNVERIRPQSLEPFDFTDVNVSGELWLAEGFTNYYGKLVMARAGLTDAESTASSFGRTLNSVISGPGRRINSAVDMSRMAPFTDAASAVDPTNFDNTYISYYTWGEAIALGLDLTLRVRSGGSTTLDDYMRALWREFGKPGGSVSGAVDRPYTLADAQRVLAGVTGDPDFADDFFDRFIEGHEVVDYESLLGHAGLVLRPVFPGQPTLGRVSLAAGMVVAELTPYGSPLHDAGVDKDDILTMLDGQGVSTARDLARIVQDKRPGDRLAIGFDRRGRAVESVVVLGEDPRLELDLVESSGADLAPQQRAFRTAWWGSQQ